MPHTMCLPCRSASPPENRDLLDFILVGKMNAGEGWSTALQKQLCYELKTFLLAGHETSAAMLTFTLIELLKNNALSSKVVAEADAVLGKDQSRVCPSRCLLGNHSLRFVRALRSRS
jgi:cytochrome P450